ncbi:MAG: glycosyltransferase [Neisseriaceae bacterium]
MIPQVKSNYILSICVPTYNRYNYLLYLLNNIIIQLENDNLWDKVEVCISDNCSTDDTASIVRNIQNQYSNLKIKYSSNESNVGFDYNLLKSVSLASGEYCWLFGDDDRFESGAIFKVVNYLTNDKNGNINGMIVGCQPYSFDFTSKQSNIYFLKKKFSSNSPENIYIKLGYFIGFISCQILRRDCWEDIVNKYDLTRYYNQYIHLFIISRIMKDYHKWVYLPDLMVGRRNDNDSALGDRSADAYIKRLRIDYAFLTVTADIFGKFSWVYFRHANIVCRYIIFANLQNMRMNINISLLPFFFEVTRKFWFCPSYFYKILPIFLLPKSTVNIIKKFKQIIRNVRV